MPEVRFFGAKHCPKRCWSIYKPFPNFLGHASGKQNRGFPNSAFFTVPPVLIKTRLKTPKEDNVQMWVAEKPTWWHDTKHLSNRQDFETSKADWRNEWMLGGHYWEDHPRMDVKWWITMVMDGTRCCPLGIGLDWTPSKWLKWLINWGWSYPLTSPGMILQAVTHDLGVVSSRMMKSRRQIPWFDGNSFNWYSGFFGKM